MDNNQILVFGTLDNEDGEEPIDTTMAWHEIFTEFESRVIGDRKYSYTNTHMLAGITPDEFREIVRLSEEAMRQCQNPLDSDFSFEGTIYKLISLLTVPGTFDKTISTYEEVWDTLYLLAEECYRYRHQVTVEEVAWLYRQYRHLSPGDMFTVASIRSEHLKLDSGDMCTFRESLRHDIPIYAKRKTMWNLWEQNDPSVDLNGIGNLTVWFPREIVEDVLLMNTLYIELDAETRFMRLLCYDNVEAYIRDHPESVRSTPTSTLH